MRRAIWVVPAAVAIATAGVATAAHANPETKHGSVVSTQSSSSKVTARRGTAIDQTAATNRAIAAAVTRSSMLGEVPASDVSVLSIRVAAANADWASAVAHPEDRRTDDAFVALHRVRGRWSVVTLGTAGVGCVVPTALRTDLHLICEPGS